MPGLVLVIMDAIEAIWASRALEVIWIAVAAAPSSLKADVISIGARVSYLLVSFLTVLTPSRESVYRAAPK